MDLPTFLATFPEFNSATYPTAQITFYLNLAATRMNACAWGTLYDYGQALYTAHCLALGAQRRLAASRGQAPGLASGPLTAKSVKDVAMSFDAKTASIDGAGNYNLTTYGTQFYELMEIVGQGGIQLGGSLGAPGTVVNQYGYSYGNSTYGPVF